jgi:hypothetical protein
VVMEQAPTPVVGFTGRAQRFDATEGRRGGRAQ